LDHTAFRVCIWRQVKKNAYKRRYYHHEHSNPRIKQHFHDIDAPTCETAVFKGEKGLAMEVKPV